MADSKLMTVEELQEFLHLGKRTVYKMIKNKEVPCVKIGGVWRFERERLEKWIGECYSKKSSPRRGQKKILVVEDEPLTREVLEREIEAKMDAKVRTADNGVAGLLAVKEFRPHLLVLDVELPEINGIEICRRLKEDPVTAEIFIVAMSGFTEKDYKEKVLAAGANVFVEKSVGIEETVKIVVEDATVPAVKA